jgi:C_GCAxxG_C_C family probable redox protein
METTERAVSYFSQGYSCSQSVLLAFAEELGLDLSEAARLASGFGGGMGRLALTCGAVTGGFMVLGMRYGSASPDDKAAKENVYALVRRFSAQFAARNGSIACSGLLDCDISTPEGMETARERSLFKTRCPALVRDSAAILSEMLPSN